MPRRPTARAVPPAQRQRQPTEIRRMLIIDAARTVIAGRGLFATTVRDIAEAAGVANGTLTYHFSGIAEILSEVLEREMAVFYEPAIEKSRGADRGADALQSLIDCFFADDERTVEHWRLWLDFWSVAAHDDRYARWQQETYLRWRADVRRMIALGCEQGDFVTDDIDTALAYFLAMFDGLAVQSYLPRSPLAPDEARENLTAWVRRTLTDAPRRRSARSRQQRRP